MNRILDFLDNEQKGIMKVIGFSTEDEYNYLLRKIYFKTQNTSTIVFSNGIPFPNNTNIINLIQSCTETMNLNCIEREEINLTNSDKVNIVLKKSIDNILANVLRDKYFKSENIKKNFFVKEIVWLYEIISKVDFEKLPTVIYYGQMTEDEKYLLEILGSFGFKVLVFSSDVDIDIQSIDNIIFDKRFPFKKYNIRVSQGLDKLPKKEMSKEDLIVVKSVAKQFKEEIEDDFIQSGIFKPWKFRQGYVKTINVDSVIEDVTTYIREDSRFRPNFKCENRTVYVPNFFIKINGVYREREKYKELINITTKNPLTVVREYINFANIDLFPTQDIYSLAFILNDNQDEIDIEKIKKHKLYKLNKYNVDAQNLALKKLNEFYSIYKEEITLKDFLDLIYLVITMEESLMVLIENFDFPYKIPKIIIYLEKRESLNKTNALLIHYFYLLGLDIVFFSPMGAPCIEDYLFNQHLSIVDLEEMVFNLPLSEVKAIKEKTKKSIFKKLLGN